MPSAEQLAGPTGALVLLLAIAVALGRVVVVLWREHLKADQDDRDQRDRAEHLAQKAIDDLGDLAEVWRERDVAEAARQRKGD